MFFHLTSSGRKSGSWDLFLTLYLASLLLLYPLCLQPLVQDVHHLPPQVHEEHGQGALSHVPPKLFYDKYLAATALLAVVAGSEVVVMVRGYDGYSVATDRAISYSTTYTELSSS